MMADTSELETEILGRLRQAVVDCDTDGAVRWAAESITAGIDPLKAMEQGLKAGIGTVGAAFDCGQAFLPEIIAAAEAMAGASTVLEKELLSRGLRPKGVGRVALATVEGDIHDIGKNIVGTMLKVAGFEVLDLGVDVPAARLVEAVREYKPQILGMSVLLTTSVPELERAIKQLKEAGIRSEVKVVVGGAAVTAQYAGRIGSDAYGEDATGAVREARRLLVIEELEQ